MGSAEILVIEDDLEMKAADATCEIVRAKAIHLIPHARSHTGFRANDDRHTRRHRRQNHQPKVAGNGRKYERVNVGEGSCEGRATHDARKLASL